MYPKEFIRNVLINEFRDIVFKHPYLSFALISIGIEFLGKCSLTKYKNWHINPETAFNKGKELLVEIDNRYELVDLKELRNGFVHTLVPKKVALSEITHGAIHFDKNKSGNTILVAEIFYRDFVIACNKIIDLEFDKKDKMCKPNLDVVI